MSIDVCYHVPLTTPINEALMTAFETLLRVSCAVIHWFNVGMGHGTCLRLLQISYLILFRSMTLSHSFQSLLPDIDQLTIPIRKWDHHVSVKYWLLPLLLDAHIMLCRRKAKDRCRWCVGRYVTPHGLSRAANFTNGFYVKNRSSDCIIGLIYAHSTILWW